MSDERKRCGDCVCFHTPKCSFAYSAEPIRPETKTVNTMKEFLEWLYDYTPKPVAHWRLASNYDIITPQNTACPDWEER